MILKNFSKNIQKIACNRIIRIHDRTIIEQTYVMETVKSSRVCTILIVDWPWDKQSLTGMVFQITNLQVRNQLDTCIANKNMVSFFSFIFHSFFIDFSFFVYQKTVFIKKK